MSTPTQLEVVRTRCAEHVPVAAVPAFLREVNSWLTRTVEGCTSGAVHEMAVVLNELLTNAVTHAPGPYTVTVTQGSQVVLIEVRDEAAAQDLPWPVGKGLLVVRGLCPRWGVTDHGAAKTVWAELPILTMPGTPDHR